MKIKRLVLRAALAAVLMVSLAGCSGYATLVRSDKANVGLIETLEKNWGKYTVFYTRTGGKHYGNVGLLFDPKEDRNTLVVRRWDKIEDKGVLSGIIADMNRRGYGDHYGPHLYRVTGPDGAFYGYFYAARRWLIAKVVGESTMHVFDFPPRPSPL